MSETLNEIKVKIQGIVRKTYKKPIAYSEDTITLLIMGIIEGNVQALITEAVERHVRIVQSCISEACSTDDDTDIDDVNEIIEYVRDNPNNYIESNGGIQLNKELL